MPSCSKPEITSEHLLETYVDARELTRFEQRYNNHLQHGHVVPAVQYDYGRCLILSHLPADIIKGIVLMEQLLQFDYKATNCCFLTAIGHAKLGNHNTALQFTKMLLNKEPNDRQGLELQARMNRKIIKEYLFQMSVVGGAVVIMGALISVVLTRHRR
ncbi:putative membrane protein involved in organellar division [Ixodes scapularis]|uniref:Membrane protein involved in organellar division, putative n=1 Tax=Ixodes scapularis TaxID=6945 RepID=B7QNJ2_IXOSC|nr:membrane protein involved in organellar division, putative [Ixodes scapularis]|eukprot:XP_002416498.1 membrane protein involved in organellar division, putative [Ixodes scapularis]